MYALLDKFSLIIIDPEYFDCLCNIPMTINQFKEIYHSISRMSKRNEARYKSLLSAQIESYL